MISSVFIIICMTVNKFIAIYMPLTFQRMNTLKNARLCISLSFIGSVLLHLPTCFRKNVVFHGLCSNTSNSPSFSANETEVVCGWQSTVNSDVADSHVFKAYVVVLEILCRVAPIVLLAILNTLIVNKFRTIVKELQVPRASLKPVSSALTPRPVSSVPVSDSVPEKRRFRSLLQNREERTLVLVSISIVVLFVCCSTPMAVMLSLLYTTGLDTHLGFQVAIACLF